MRKSDRELFLRKPLTTSYTNKKTRETYHETFGRQTPFKMEKQQHSYTVNGVRVMFCRYGGYGGYWGYGGYGVYVGYGGYGGYGG